jgi:hypothetical protein
MLRRSRELCDMAAATLSRLICACLTLRAEIGLGLDRGKDRVSARRAALEYVCYWMEQGGTFKMLATSIVEETGVPVSERFLVLVGHRLEKSANARGRMKAAREAHTAQIRESLLGEARRLFGQKAAIAPAVKTTPTTPVRPITIDDLRYTDFSPRGVEGMFSSDQVDHLVRILQDVRQRAVA